MSRDTGVFTPWSALRRLELWALLIALVAVSQPQAEFYLASFGSSGMHDAPQAWSFTLIAYDVRHLWELAFFFLAPVVIVVFFVWLWLALCGWLPTARWLLGRTLALTAIALTVLVAASWPAREVRREGFRRSANHMTPLVAAIRRFEADLGRPPHELAELTPQYLANVHHFGVRGCRSLRYSVADAAASWRWQLWLECPNGFVTLDRFVFRPTGDYSDWGNLERMGEWAYFWD